MIVTSYTFDKTAKTITFPGFSSIAIERVQFIYDRTANVTIYQMNKSGLGGTAATNVLTLEYNTNTGTFANTDKLIIYYNTDSGAPVFDGNGYLISSLGTSLQRDLDGITTVPYGALISPVITADTSVLTGAGHLHSIFVSAASATPTVKIWDNTAASGNVVVDTFTPVAATRYFFDYARIANGIYVDVGGTVSLTVYYDNIP